MQNEANDGGGNCNKNTIAFGDYGCDGLVDVITTGWTNVNDKAWGTYVFLQNAYGTFAIQEPSGLPTLNFGNGGYTVGRLFGENAVDAFGIADKDDWVYAYKNVNDESAIELPAEPTKVAATQADGKITVTWASDENNLGLGYNVYAKNTATGKIASILSADLTTGKLRSFESLCTTVRSDDPSAMKFEVTLPNGDYEVGVQAVAADGSASKFTTAKITTGINNVTNAEDNSTEETVYSLSGTKVNKTTGRGIFIVKNGNKITKVIK